MRIGFDAKRYFFNRSGLGNYSRFVVDGLSHYFPKNDYLLFSPKKGGNYSIANSKNQTIVTPPTWLPEFAGSAWRSYGIANNSQLKTADIYHGLSHELPVGLQHIKKIVTIHDCIFLRFPELFDFGYRTIFKQKYAHSIKVSDRIVAISQQTKNDIIQYFEAPEEKIDIVYQGCNPLFYKQIGLVEKASIKQKYNLPSQFILFVGTIEKRKNLKSIFEAIAKQNIDIPIVAVGRPTPYLDEIKHFVEQNNLNNRAIFLHQVTNQELPALYQMATIFVYPSLFEGFGIPILEALVSGTPVITSTGSCFPEVGGPDSVYVDYGNIDELAFAIDNVLQHAELQKTMTANGLQHAKLFDAQKVANDMMKIYNTL